MLCWLYARCNMVHSLHKYLLLSPQSTKYFIKSCWGLSRWILRNLRWAFIFPLVSSDFHLSNSLLYTIFLSVFWCCWIVKTEVNWVKWSLLCFEVFQHILNESQIHFCSIFDRNGATPGVAVNHALFFFFLLLFSRIRWDSWRTSMW